MKVMKILLRQNLLLVPFSYDREKYWISNIEMKTVLGQNLLLVSFWFC